MDMSLVHMHNVCGAVPSWYIESPPPPPVRVTPRYVVLDTSTDLVLEARFRGNYYAHDWVYNEDDSTFNTGLSSLFTAAIRTNVGQTYTIPAGSASLRVGYYGPYLLPMQVNSVRPTPANVVIVGSFGKYSTDLQYIRKALKHPVMYVAPLYIYHIL